MGVQNEFISHMFVYYKNILSMHIKINDKLD